jgi:hypothetical protein
MEQRWFVRVVRLGVAGLAALVAVAALAVVVPGLTARAEAQTPPAPVCPAGSTFNATTGQCETPATVTPCPTGTTVSGAVCTATVICPDIFVGITVARQVVGNPTGATAATCALVFIGPPVFRTTISCPVGTTITSFVKGAALFTSGTITCTAPVTRTCPAGFTLSGTVCVAPATFACPAGHVQFNGLCFPLGGTAGPADASGGNGGSARGGDGGRGGTGTAPMCTQNASDPGASMDCGAGGQGGPAGDGGVSEGGEGGVAFSEA